MQSANENKADTPQVATPPLGRTQSESQRVRKEQQGAVQFCARLGRTPTETQDMLSSAYQQDALRKTVTKTYHKRFENLGVDVYKSNTKAKKAKNTTGDKKPSIDEKKSEENGKANETDNGEQEKMNVEQGDEEQNTSKNGEGEHQPQSESDPKEPKKDSSDKSEQSSDSSQLNKTSDKGSTEKVEGGTTDA